jgi:hypothetical protein
MRSLFLGHFNNDGCCARHEFIIAVQHIWRRNGSIEFLRHHADTCLRLWRWLLCWPDLRPMGALTGLLHISSSKEQGRNQLPPSPTGSHLTRFQTPGGLAESWFAQARAMLAWRITKPHRLDPGQSPKGTPSLFPSRSKPF